MELAICQWTPDTSEGAVEALHAQEVTALEPGAPFLAENDEHATKVAGARYRSAGIRLYSCHAPFDKEDDLSSLDGAAREVALARHVTALNRAAAAGCEWLIVHPGGRATAEEVPRRIDKLRRSLEKLLRHAERAAMGLAVENMPPGFVGSRCADLHRVVVAIDCPRLRLCLDTGHAHMTGEGATAGLETLRELLAAFHLHDNDSRGDQHLQPGYGTIDWVAFARSLTPMACGFPIAVEAAPWAGADWRTQLQEVRTLLTEGRLSIRIDGRSVHAVCPMCHRLCLGLPGRWACGCGPAGPLLDAR